VRLTFLGGARQVGRSAILLQTPESRVLLDCGVDVSSDDDAYPHLEAPEFNISELDVYDRYLTELYLVKINNLFSRNPADLKTDAAKAEFQTAFGEAIKYAQRAIELNNSDYQNWMEAGRVYAIAVPMKITGAYENASSNYNKASALNPQSPLLYLTLAQLDLANTDSKKARTDISQALKLKPDYTDAIFLSAQIDANEGNLSEAIKSVEKVALETGFKDEHIFYEKYYFVYSF